MKSKLSALIIGIGPMLWASVGIAEVAFIVPDPAQEKRDKQRFEWEKEDRQNQKKKQEEMETRGQDARRESAYAESKAANKAKVKKMRKQAGLKPHNSWQLNH